ncbi:MAG: hypothetical protein AB7G44_01635 [Bacteroidia bacterium]
MKDSKWTDKEILFQGDGFEIIWGTFEKKKHLGMKWKKKRHPYVVVHQDFVLSILSILLNNDDKHIKKVKKGISEFTKQLSK